jgi:hypothetical protein
MYSREEKIKIAQSKCESAAKTGDLMTIKRQFSELGSDVFTGWVCAYAAQAGHFELIKWSVYHGAPLNVFVCAHAARIGRLDMLKWLKNEACPWDERTPAFAAAEGHIDCVIWAVENKCPHNALVVRHLAEFGNVDIIKIMYDMQWSLQLEGFEHICRFAACGGQVHVLQWAREQGFHWDGVYADYFKKNVGRTLDQIRFLATDHYLKTPERVEHFMNTINVLESATHIKDIQRLIGSY